MAPIVTMAGPKTPHGKESSTTSAVDVMQNIKVFVRCRPLKATEKKNVIEVMPERREVRINESKNSNERYNSKTFTFDNVFAADTTQLHVYHSVVEPLIEQVVMGYNCTVFAYGQTGTGKTYTMEGERSLDDAVCSWAEDPIAGIIPRALHQLFETLADEKCTEYTVRVSFLELYNEELYDLLSSIDDTTKLKIFEDTTRKGSVVVNGLEEVTVHSKAEIYEILRKGSAKRQTAATLLNACSSRSHTIFSVTVHIKENAIDGEDLVKIGKLNLVDLAGSENIGRSGAMDKRAREAGNINQSLLTLGRVITSLVDRTPHIPYRESKLTRLLQESLGGRTKTSIIATISPNIADADDSLSTLEYAHRAKKITNKPEINQKMSKKTLLREYTEEIERLRRDLLAAREKNGIYVNEENFKQMETQIKDQIQDIEDKVSEINALHEEIYNIQQLFDETKADLETKATELEVTHKTLEKTSHELKDTKSDLHLTKVDRDEQKHLVGVHVNTERVLTTQAKDLLNVAETTTSDVDKLHGKVDRLKTVESNNWTKTESFQDKFMNDMNRLEDLVTITTSSYNDSLDEMKTAINEKTSATEAVVVDTQNKIISLTSLTTEHMTRLSSIIQKDRLVLEQNIALKDNNSDIGSFLCQSFNQILAQVVKNQTTISEDIIKMNEIIAKQREDVEEVVMKQNTHLRSVSKITVNSLNNIKNDMKLNFESQNKELVALMEQMEKSKEENNKLEVNLDKQMEELVQSLHAFNANRIKTRVNSQNLSSDLNTKLIETKKNGINYLQEMSSKVDGYVSLINVEEKVGLKYVESVDDLNTQNTQQLMDRTNELNNKNTELPNETQELINARKEATIEKVSQLGHLINDSINVCDKQITAKQTALKEMTEFLTQGLEEQKTFVESIVDNVTYITESVEEKTAEMSRMTQTMERSHIREIENRYKSFEEFVKNDLMKDMPTGTTPQKTEYRFPRDLVQTSPHERLLQRFRLNNACETSLPEENESEFLSDSNSSTKSTIDSANTSNDENVKPLKDTQKRRKQHGIQSKSKSNSSMISISSLKSITESDQTYVLESQPSKRLVTPKPLTANRNN